MQGWLPFKQLVILRLHLMKPAIAYYFSFLDFLCMEMHYAEGIVFHMQGVWCFKDSEATIGITKDDLQDPVPHVRRT